MSRSKGSNTWAAMRTSPNSQQPLGSTDGPAPLFWKPRGQQVSKPPPESDAFPSLIGNSTSRPQEPAPGQRLVGGAGAGPKSRAPATEGLGRRRSLSAPSLPSITLLQPYSAIAGSSSKKPAGHSPRSSGVDRSQPKQQHGQHSIHTTQVSHQPTPQQQPLPQQQLQQGADTGLQLLQECHPWCEAVMLHEVLQAVGGDVAAALEALQQMLPADGQCIPGPGSSCSDGSCSDTSIEQALGVTTSSSKAAGSGLRQNWPAGPTDQPDQAVEDAAAQLHQLRVHDNSSQQQQQQGQVPGEDTYRVIRGDAVKLSHKYRKASKRAAAARSQGDYSAAAQLAAEALSIKAAADAAHAAAALKIEVANNAETPFGLWELDLHGLHVTEALQALAERVQLLSDISQDLRKQSAVQPAASRGSPAAGVAGFPAVGNTKQTVLTSLLLPGGDVTWGQQLAAMRQELRVIVGKGLHSSGGEASLPRVVEQWLLQRGYKYIWREGFINVQLRLL